MPGRGGRGIGWRGGASFARRTVRRAAILIVIIEGNKYAREYDGSKQGYTNYPIQEKDGKEYYSKTIGEETKDYSVKTGEEITI